MDNNPIKSIFRTSSSLFVNDLPEEVSEAALFEKFSKFGIILAIRVNRDRATHRSLGCAYVRFQNPNCAEKCMKDLQLTPVFGEDKICILWAQPSTEHEQQRNYIVIKNLDEKISMDMHMVRETFSAFGKILKCKVPMNSDGGSSKGFAFVCFEETSTAEMAVEKMNGMTLGGDGDPDRFVSVEKIISVANGNNGKDMLGSQPLLVLKDENDNPVSDPNTDFDYQEPRPSVYVNYEEEMNEEVIQEFLSFLQEGPETN